MSSGTIPGMGTNHRETPVELLERWEHYGATWRAVHISDGKAIVDLCTCHGEPVDRIESGDPALIRFVRERGAD
jgi:hypothetical protein